MGVSFITVGEDTHKYGTGQGKEKPACQTGIKSFSMNSKYI